CWCRVTIVKPVPTVNRINGTNGFLKRIWFTSYSSARAISFLASWLPARNLPITEPSTRDAGTIFFGAFKRFVSGDGSTASFKNNRPNQPGVIFVAVPLGFPFNALFIGGKYTSFITHKWSKHCPILHELSVGCQFSCSSLRPSVNSRARSSAASRSEISRELHVAILRLPLSFQPELY